MIQAWLESHGYIVTEDTVTMPTGERWSYIIAPPFANHAYIELRRDNSLGWAYTTLAQFILFYLPEHKHLLWVSAVTLRESLSNWNDKYRTGYDKDSIGRLVPAHELYKAATYKMILDD